MDNVWLCGACRWSARPLMETCGAILHLGWSETALLNSNRVSFSQNISRERISKQIKTPHYLKNIMFESQKYFSLFRDYFLAAVTQTTLPAQSNLLHTITIYWYPRCMIGYWQIDTGPIGPPLEAEPIELFFCCVPMCLGADSRYGKGTQCPVPGGYKYGDLALQVGASVWRQVRILPP
jgi:hypothetical protein